MMTRQQKLFDDAKDAREPKDDDEIDRWLARLTDKEAGEVWRSHFEFLKTSGIPARDALIITWLSLDKTSRKNAKLATLGKLANFLGISRQAMWEHIRQHQWGVPGEERNLVEWAEDARKLRLALLLADVDNRLYQESVRAKAKSATIKLFYQRAGVLKDEVDLHHMGADDGPVEYSDVSDAELDAIRQALAGQAEGGGQAG